jgi:putative transposase
VLGILSRCQSLRDLERFAIRHHSVFTAALALELQQRAPWLVISDAHLGLTAAIKRMFQGCSWQRCRVHILRILLSHVPKAGQDMVAAALKAVFVIQKPEQVRAHWQQVTEMLRKQFPSAVPVMEAARDVVLAFLHFPQEHWRKIWSTNPLERLASPALV